MFAALARSIFGTQNDRILRSYQKTVDRINALEKDIIAMDDPTLRAQTTVFRDRLTKGESVDALLPEAFATAREAARRALGLRPFDVQLMGAIALHEGYIPEMRTGEGKTLTATLAVYLNALSGKGVHVVTVNDYLAQRDANWMRPVFEFLGMTVGWIIGGLSETDRRAAYAADVTYATNNELGFDYLRDNMKFHLKDMVQRDFHYAIVDEVDSILIDEARTPLVISGPTHLQTDTYVAMNRVIPHLEPQDYEIDEKFRSIHLTEAGNEHAEQVMAEMNILTDGGLYDPQNVHLVFHLTKALAAHKVFTRDVDYVVKDGEVVIIDQFTGRMMEGRRYSEGLHQAIEAKEGVKIQDETQTLASITFQNYFRMYPKLSGMTGTALTEKKEFEEIYNLSAVEIPTNLPQVRRDYDDEVYRTNAEKYNAIIAQIRECHARQQPILVGTTSIEKSEVISDVLKKHGIAHQVLNARYHEHEAQIIAQAGQPGAVTIATNMAGRGTDIKLGGNLEARLAADIPADADDETRKKLTEKITADIARDAALVKEAGGLFVIGSERHESRRIDNQLRGRSGRQGDPGASKFYISLEDDLMRRFGSEKMDVFLQRMGLQEGQPIAHNWLNSAIERAQKKVEGQHFEQRKSLLRFDNVMNEQRKVIYEQRREIMQSDNVADIIVDMRRDVIDTIVDAAIPRVDFPEQWDGARIATEFFRISKIQVDVPAWTREDDITPDIVRERLYAAADEKMAAKEELIGSDNMRQVEKGLLLETLDRVWKEHLLALDHLHFAVGLRQVAQRDPLHEYKADAFTLFGQMLDTLRERITTQLLLVEFTLQTPEEAAEQQRLMQEQMARQNAQNLTMGRGSLPPAGDAAPPERKDNVLAGTFVNADFDPQNPATWSQTPRNAPCPCGSGKKYKYCHGRTN